MGGHSALQSLYSNRDQATDCESEAGQEQRERVLPVRLDREGVGCNHRWSKGFLSRGANRYKGPGAGMNLMRERVSCPCRRVKERAVVGKGRDKRGRSRSCGREFQVFF